MKEDYEKAGKLTYKIGLVLREEKPSPGVLLFAMCDSFLRAAIVLNIDKEILIKLFESMQDQYENFKKEHIDFVHRNMDEIMEKIKAHRESDK